MKHQHISSFKTFDHEIVIPSPADLQTQQSSEFANRDWTELTDGKSTLTLKRQGTNLSEKQRNWPREKYNLILQFDNLKFQNGIHCVW